ncbi:hypothetical protein PPYR_13070 [Photinus pyralis]|uniref:Cilia- and flagella-associated protein 45 n=1 Tax=Photinus pyralis TaxID=7054 RepID=A0A5N4A7Y4_PHOPY|nr:cilia- and flagella-associated protein 45-like [Photinus pyralis]XP_031354387.1 cilia- and flagella-associated protein 45-like [Photinus pyralis]KAB0793441.1 hypothetical protein PPYR_13061 [Photinus pyralis]KAB0793450.1 hypothetical protein PPYR_13070 [Photinus pyralis]
MHSIKKNGKADVNDHRCNHIKLQDKSVIQVFGKNQIRKLIIPSREPIKTPGIWPSTEFKRLQKAAYVLTQKDKLAMIEEAQQRKLQIQTDCERRKESLKKSQLEQRAKPDSKLAKEEGAAAEKNQYVLQRAYELRQEQEDEVKNASSMILAAKCLAVRQQQLVEKDLMKRELDEEERRLDSMMEQERQKKLKEEEERKRYRRELGQRNAQAISQQISENQVQKLLEEERKEEECRNINKAMIRMQQDDAEKIRQTHLAQKKIREDLAESNAKIEHFKIVQKEEERIANLRIEEFTRKKAEAQAARDAELAEIKAAKEREIARLRDAQLKAQQAQAADDEVQALRRQEEYERQWREKQKAEARRKKEMDDALKKARAIQMEDLRKLQAIEIQKEEEEFHKVARVQQELFEKDLQQKREKKEAAIRHRKELLMQINEKEKEKILQIKQKFQEGDTLRMEQEVRNINIQNVIKRKVQKMRENNVPENFVSDIERQLKVK